MPLAISENKGYGSVDSKTPLVDHANARKASELMSKCTRSMQKCKELLISNEKNNFGYAEVYMPRLTELKKTENELKVTLKMLASYDADSTELSVIDSNLSALDEKLKQLTPSFFDGLKSLKRTEYGLGLVWIS